MCVISMYILCAVCSVITHQVSYMYVCFMDNKLYHTVATILVFYENIFYVYVFQSLFIVLNVANE